MFRVGLLFLLLDLTLIVVALIDCLSTDEYEIRNLPKIVWAFLIVLFSPIGGIAWFLAGRPKKAPAAHGGEGWWPGGGISGASRSRPVAPDDDPEFLRQLNDKTKRDDMDLLRRLEEDLKRREEDPKRDKPTDDTTG
jgi:hypothetical protein